MILSFDVGITNLAYCVISDDATTIHRWDVCKIPSPQQNLDGLIAFLNDLNFDTDVITTVLVEKQPSRNCKMRILENILLTYFKVKSFTHVTSFSPKLKLGKDLGKLVKGKSNYSTRKKYGILLTTRYLKDYAQSETIQDVFEKHKKKDDLSDALLQGLCYIRSSLVDELSTCIVTV